MCRRPTEPQLPLNLYLISQDQNDDYDTYDSAVVAARNEEEARCTCPGGRWGMNYTGWCTTPDFVDVEFIGPAKSGMEAGVVISSFNAG